MSDYSIVATSGHDIQDVLANLLMLVIDDISRGWQPVGGVSSVYNNGIYVCCQSMVKYG